MSAGCLDGGDGQLDLDALAFDVTEHLSDMAGAKARMQRVYRAAQRYWRQLRHHQQVVLHPEQGRERGADQVLVVGEQQPNHGVGSSAVVAAGARGSRTSRR